MTFLAVFLSLVLERYAGSLSDLRRFDFFRDTARRFALANPIFDGIFGCFILLGGVAFVIGIVDVKFGQWLSLLELAFSVAVLYWCFGPQSFYDQAKNFSEALAQGHEENITWYAEQLIGRQITAEERSNVARLVAELLLIMVNERLLGVVFWFLLLGPVGAWLYRGTHQLIDLHAAGDEPYGVSRAAQKVFFVLNWPSARLVSLTFLLVGNYVQGYRQIKEMHATSDDQHFTDNDKFVASTGMGALGWTSSSSIESRTETSVGEVLALARRTIMIWIATIALFTLFGS